MPRKKKQHLTVHDMPTEERPRERLLTQGAASLSNAELLAILLRTGTKQENVLQLAARLLSQYDGLGGLARVDAEMLRETKGLGSAKITQILAALELGKRLAKLVPEERPLIQDASDAARLLMDMGYLPQEQIRVILLDSARRVIAAPTVYVGTVNASLVRVAELYREAIVRNSPAMIMAHNHPSGVAEPSQSDERITQRLRDALALIDVRVLDHFVVGDQLVSMSERGLL
ncbi:MAG: RadC family protein [Aggregatilineales bacterium]